MSTSREPSPPPSTSPIAVPAHTSAVHHPTLGPCLERIEGHPDWTGAALGFFLPAGIAGVITVFLWALQGAPIMAVFTAVHALLAVGLLAGGTRHARKNRRVLHVHARGFRLSHAGGESVWATDDIASVTRSATGALILHGVRGDKLFLEPREFSGLARLNRALPALSADPRAGQSTDGGSTD